MPPSSRLSNVSPMTELERSNRTIIRLLSALVVLLAIIVASGAVAAIVGYRQYTKLKAAIPDNSQLESLSRSIESATKLAGELSERQRALSAALDKDADRTEERIAGLASRRGGLQKIRSGPIDKMAQLIELNQLLADEMLAMLDHMTRTQTSLSRAARPLPTQRKAMDAESHRDAKR